MEVDDMPDIDELLRTEAIGNKETPTPAGGFDGVAEPHAGEKVIKTNVESQVTVHLNGMSHESHVSDSSIEMADSGLTKERDGPEKTCAPKGQEPEPMDVDSEEPCNGDVPTEHTNGGTDAVVVTELSCSSENSKSSVEIIDDGDGDDGDEDEGLRSQDKNFVNAANSSDKSAVPSCASKAGVEATGLVKSPRAGASESSISSFAPIKNSENNNTSSVKEGESDAPLKMATATPNKVHKMESADGNSANQVIKSNAKEPRESIITVVQNGEQDDADVLVLEPVNTPTKRSSVRIATATKHAQLSERQSQAVKAAGVGFEHRKTTNGIHGVGQDQRISRPLSTMGGVASRGGMVTNDSKLIPKYHSVPSSRGATLTAVPVGRAINQPVTCHAKAPQSMPQPQPPSVMKKQSPIGAFNQSLYDIGLDLVTERVYKDGFQETDKKLKEIPCDQMKDRLQRIEKSLKKYQKKNEAFRFPLKHCKRCGFASESELALGLHHMFPHLTSYNDLDMKCGHCDYQTRQKQAFVFHMEAEHNVKARFDRKRAFYECPMCQFEDNNKLKVVKHKERCFKAYKLKRNLAPTAGHELPLPPPVKKLAVIPVQPIRHVLPKPGSSNLQGQYSQYRPLVVPASQSAKTIVRGVQSQSFMQQSKMTVPSYLSSRIVYSQGNMQYAGGNYRIVNSAQSSGLQPQTVTTTVANRTLQPTSVPNMSTFVVCEICDGYIKDLESLQRHILWIHHIEVADVKQPPPLKCSLCSSRFFTIKGLERHFQKIHKSNVYSSGMAANKAVTSVPQPRRQPPPPQPQSIPSLVQPVASGSAGPVPVALFQNISNLPPTSSNTAEVTVFNRFNAKARPVSVSTPVFPCISCKKSFYSHLFWLKHIKENHMPPCRVKLCHVDRCSKCIVENTVKGIRISFSLSQNGSAGSEIVLE